MRVIVVGAGEVGYHVADRMAQEKHDVVVVDTSSARLDYVQSHIDVAVVEGSGASPAILERAGVKEGGLLIAVSNVDEVNLVCCAIARDNPELMKIARVSNPDFYSGKNRLEARGFGVDVMINPERELALETFRLLQITVASDVAEFAGGAVQVLRLKVLDDAPVAGRHMVEVGKELGTAPILTVGLERDGEMTVPRGKSEIHGGDYVYVAAAREAIPRVLELCGYRQTALNRVMIAGGSHEAFYLSRLLGQYRVQTILVVKERERAQELAEKLEKTLVLNADATDVELLELEGVGDVDAFVALTEKDETNILSSLMAKHAGAHQVVTLVNKVDYLPLVKRIGLDAAVSPRLSAANAILRHVRRGSVTRVATLKDSDAEVMQFEVSSTSPIRGRSLQDVDFPAGAIVATLVRGHRVIVPRGRDAAQPGDTAIVFSLPKAVSAVTELFAS
jgi:trk system potassium uptake protein TrkA